MSEQIRFGVEFEMVLRPREDALPLLEEYFDFVLTGDDDSSDSSTNRTAIMRFLQAYLGQQGIPMNVLDGDKTTASELESDYTKWSIVEDPSIAAADPDYGIELVSPIFVSDFADDFSQCTGT